MTRFLEEFPNALDIVVRAIRSGLPLHDGIRLIASESPEPVRGEFRRIVEAQQIGLSIPDAASRMQETMPCPEAGFFGVVIQIQNQAGGNISEALDNLSRVLRDRKRMKAKIKALSMEVKVSAVIIGALPFVVATLVMMLNPGYILPLFLTSTGNRHSRRRRNLDGHRPPGHAADDELEGLRTGIMIDRLVAIFTDLSSLVAVLVGVAAFATLYSLVPGFVATGSRIG